MGLPAGKVPAEDLQRVMAELATRCDVELPQEEDGKRQYIDTLRTALVGWTEFHDQERQYADWTGEAPIFERGEWTEEGLKALPNRGGVCITIVGPRNADAPHMIPDTERVQRPKNFYYFELEGYHLSVLDLSAATSYVWWRTPAEKRGTAK